MVLDDRAAKVKWTPAESKPFSKDEYFIWPSGKFGYSIVLDMMLYLAEHTHPDITYALNCCTCYMFCSQHYRELELKRRGPYFKGAINNGLILNPYKEL